MSYHTIKAGNYRAYKLAGDRYKIVDTLTGEEVRRWRGLSGLGRILKVLSRLDKR